MNLQQILPTQKMEKNTKKLRIENLKDLLKKRNKNNNLTPKRKHFFERFFPISEREYFL